MIVVGVSKNGWITPELKHAWYCHVRSHPDFPEPHRPVFWQFDGHFTNYEPDLIITAAAWLSSQNGPTIIKKGIDTQTQPTCSPGMDGLKSLREMRRLGSWTGSCT